MLMQRHVRPLGASMLVLLGAGRARSDDSPWLYGIHWVGSTANHADLDALTGDKAIWTLETVMTHDGYGAWGPEGQLSKFQYVVNNMGYTIVCRVQPVWGKAFPLPGDEDPSLAEFLDEVTHTAQLFQDVCHIWHLGNEMNLLDEWGGQALMPENYIDKAVQFSDRIKAVASSLGPQIVLVGPAGVGDSVGGGKHMACTEYINRMCDHINNNNYHDKFDGFAMHAYGNQYFTDLPNMLHLFEDDTWGFGYQYQVGLLDNKGFTNSPVYITEWNRYTSSPNGEREAASAQFLHNALTRLHAWNQDPAHHPIVCACWFIYPISDAQWDGYSLLKMKNGDDYDHDCWHAFQYAAQQNYPAGSFEAPEIELSVSQFSHVIMVGTDLPNDTFTVRNSGTGTLNYSITEDAGWFYVPVGSGSSTGEPDTITVDYTTAGLDVGTYEATITVSGNAYNSPEEIAVALEVKPIPGDFDEDGDVDQDDFGRFQACYSGAGNPHLADCEWANLEGDDNDVDPDDFAKFQQCMSGPNVPAVPDCAD